MADRRDRLAAMTQGDTVALDTAPQPRPSPAAVRTESRRALLYAPPPAPASSYVAILQAEGVDVLLADRPETARRLLDTAPPSLIVAVVPVLGEELRALFREKAPQAELRVVPGLGRLLDDWVMPPREAVELCVRGVAAVSELLAAGQGKPTGQIGRMVHWCQGACESLGFTAAEITAARLAAALVPASRAQAPDADPAAETLTGTSLDRERLSGFATGLGVPLAGSSPEAGATDKPTPLDVVEAAVAYSELVEDGARQPDLALRRRVGPDRLNAAAVEALLAATGRQATRLRGTVLLIDPDVAARTVLALRLSNEGYQVEGSSDGRQALELVRRNPPALIVSEAVLPGLDGFGLLDALKREGRGGIPFVFLSSRSDALSANKGLLLGAADYLAKPANVELLLTKLQKLAGQAISRADVSARISLSDVDGGGSAAGYATVSYDELAPDVMLMGRFRILADLGEGGMGKVFKARDERLEEEVVIKVMKDSLTGDPKVLEHFKREIRLARKISHPAVVRTFDFWEAGPVKFVTMECLEGADLAQELRRRGALPLPVALRITTELLEGLGAAHDLGVVHRDIKPHNLFLLKAGRVKILDFGIAQGLDPRSQDGQALTASVIGTPEYMSPEQIVGERLDSRTDLYSAGVVAFELLTGRLPFAGADRIKSATLRLRSEAPAPSSLRPEVGGAVDAFVGRLLRRNREERHASAADALADLRRIRAA